jgi:hypothetical protein
MTVSEESRDREVRAARNQSLFREINERVKELNEGFQSRSPDRGMGLRVRQRDLHRTGFDVGPGVRGDSQ